MMLQSENYQDAEILTPGCITWTWCSCSMARLSVDIVKHSLVCLECEDKETPGQDDREGER